MTRATLRQELAKLSRAERLELVQEIWDSIADGPDDLDLDAEERALLEERVAAPAPSGGGTAVVGREASGRCPRAWCPAR